MNTQSRLGAAAFNRRITFTSQIWSLPALALVLATMLSLVELTAQQTRWFLAAVAIWTLFVTPPTVWLHQRLMAPVLRYLRQRELSAASEADRRDAFRSVMAMPLRLGLVGALSWILPTLAIACLMVLRFELFDLWHFVVLIASGATAGAVMGIFLTLAVKHDCEPVRSLLAREIPNPAERARLVLRYPLRMRLLASLAVVGITPLVFAALLARAESARVLELAVVGWQQQVLDAVAEQALRGSDLEAARSEALGSFARRSDLRVAILDPERGAPELGLSRELAAQIREELAAGAVSGDSLGVSAPATYAWRRLPDGRLLASISASAGNRDSTASPLLAYAFMLMLTAGAALGIAWQLARDVSGVTDALAAEMARVAGGDLRPGRGIESEDELGDLARSFQTMAESLQGTVQQVAEAADRVESTAGVMAQVSADLRQVSLDQVQGVQKASAAVEGIAQQVRGIADSAQALNLSVEESSSSVLELGSAGRELDETAGMLSARVDEVASSLEELFASVKQVAGNTGALAQAAVETSSSMDEIASSLRSVDADAEETANLSRRVVASAEQGQQKVHQTIEGMEAIRESSELAEQVIQNLAQRASEIGAIVDVIDDVADETNLLALNAAIIAAQAGEHGRAFSVVADEIKDLADRVLASTKEIGSLIDSLQAEAKRAIAAVERGSKSVASGVDLTAEAGLSLEAINRSAQESGTRIGSIVNAVREQARAASFVLELTERVRGGVEEIRGATDEQRRGTESIHRNTAAMRDAARQVRSTTQEQARGAGRIRESVEGVRSAVEQINDALQEQSAASRATTEFLEGIARRTGGNEESARRLDEVARGLQKHAEALREGLAQFRI